MVTVRANVAVNVMQTRKIVGTTPRDSGTGWRLVVHQDRACQYHGDGVGFASRCSAVLDVRKYPTRKGRATPREEREVRSREDTLVCRRGAPTSDSWPPALPLSSNCTTYTNTTNTGRQPASATAQNGHRNAAASARAYTLPPGAEGAATPSRSAAFRRRVGRHGWRPLPRAAAQYSRVLNYTACASAPKKCVLLVCLKDASFRKSKNIC